MPRDINQAIKLMGRRRMLKTLGSIGIAGMTIPYISEGVLANIDLKDQIPFVEKLVHENPQNIKEGAIPNRSPIWDTISREKWVQVEATNNAMRKVEKSYRARLILPELT